MGKDKGVNAILYEWAMNSGLFKFAFGKTEDFPRNTLYTFFNANEEEERKKAGNVLYEMLWGAHCILGPLPPIHLLQKFEYGRVFYADYRDHTGHTLITCFLGLYIYDNNTVIRNAISKYLDEKTIRIEDYTKDDLFVVTWLLTSLYHDLGYLVENEKIDGEYSSEFTELVNEINKMLKTPLASIPRYSKKCDSEFENKFIDDHEIHVPSFSSIDVVEKHFASLHEGSMRSNLAIEGINGVEEYYNFAKSHRPQGRTSFRDHGIYSALLLLHIWTSFDKYIESAISTDGFDAWYKNICKDIHTLSSEMKPFFDVVEIAAQAISLHNINKSIWQNKDVVQKQINLSAFSIKLNEEKTGLPFAFLLRLCDELQTWDRPRYREPAPNDRNLYSSDICVAASNDNVFVRYYLDEKAFWHPDTYQNGYFIKLKKHLEKYLDPADISSILKYDLDGYTAYVRSCVDTSFKKPSANSCYNSFKSSQNECIESVLRYFCENIKNALNLKTDIEAVVVIWTDNHIKRRTFYSCNKQPGSEMHRVVDYSYGVVGLLQKVLEDDATHTDCILFYDSEKNPIECEYIIDYRSQNTTKRVVSEQEWKNQATKAMLAISLFRQKGDIPRMYGALTLDFAETLKKKGDKQKLALFESVRKCRDILVPLLVTEIDTDFNNQLLSLEKEEQESLKNGREDKEQ